jgi:hypothetical protein
VTLERAWKLALEYAPLFEGMNVYEVNDCWEWWSAQRRSKWRVPLNRQEVEQAVVAWRGRKQG